MSKPKHSPNVTALPATVGDRAEHPLVSEQIETTGSQKLAVDAELENLQHQSFNYFLYETNPANGLVIDKTETNWPSSIPATGLALASYPVAVERGFIPRAAAVERTLTILRFFWNSPQGPEPDAIGYKGFYYHFLDMQTGRRVNAGSSQYSPFLPGDKNEKSNPDHDAVSGCWRRPTHQRMGSPCPQTGGGEFQLEVG